MRLRRQGLRGESESLAGTRPSTSLRHPFPVRGYKVRDGTITRSHPRKCLNVLSEVPQLFRETCVIPFLVGGAKLLQEQELPEDLRPLLRRNAFDLSDSRWDYDVQRLGDATAKLLGVDPGRRSVRIWATAALLPFSYS